MPVPVLARPNQQATNQQAIRNTIAPETVDTLVVVDRRTDEHLPVTAEPVRPHQCATGDIFALKNDGGKAELGRTVR